MSKILACGFPLEGQFRFANLHFFNEAVWMMDIKRKREIDDE